MLNIGCKTELSSQNVQPVAHHRGDASCGLVLGQSTLQSDDAFPVDREYLFGFVLRAINLESFPVGAEIGYNYRGGSNDHESIPGVGTFDFQTRTDEVYVGIWVPIVTKEFYHPYFAAGGSEYEMRVDGQEFNVSGSDKDIGYGVYARFGVLFNLTDHLQWGIDARGVLGNRLHLFGAETHGNFTQAALTLMYGF
jgi:hypothetical protein